MDGFSLKAAWLNGPALIRRAPVAVLVWVLLRSVGQYVSLAVVQAARDAHLGPLASNLWGAAVDLPFQAVLVTAVVRACLGLGDPRRVYLDVGATEARMAVLIVLGGLVAMLIALPASIAATYLAYFLKQKLLAGSVLGIGATVSALALMRLAPMPAVLVAEGRFDPAEALAASRGRYWRLTGSILAAAVLQRLAQDGMGALLHPPRQLSWSGLASPLRVGATLWDSLMGVLALIIMAGIVASAWRAQRQTLS